MNIPIPSKQALRYLASLCRASRQPAKSTRAYSVCSSRKTSVISYLPQTRPNSPHSFRNSTPNRFFNSTRSTRNTLSSTGPTPLQPDTTTPYTLFPSTLALGPPPSGPFSIPLRPLRAEFLRLQSSHHPDKFPPGPLHKHALALSAVINTFYITLSDPLLRAQYLLQNLYAIDVTSEDNTAHPTDQSTLMEVMDAQEAIEECSTQAEIAELMASNQTRIESTTAKMAEAFERNDSEAAKRECVRLKYWRSLQDGLKDWEPGKAVRLIH